MRESETGHEVYPRPAAGECYCHLMKGHPHASMNDVCDICKADYEEWSDQVATAIISDAERRAPARIELGPLAVAMIDTLEVALLERMYNKKAVN